MNSINIDADNNYGIRCVLCGFIIFPDEFDFFRSQAVHRQCGLRRFKKLGGKKESYEAYRFKKPKEPINNKDDYNARLRLRYRTDPNYRERKLELNREWSKKHNYVEVRKKLDRKHKRKRKS